MEYSLRHGNSVCFMMVGGVLILILMEYSLRLKLKTRETMTFKS